MKLVKTYIIIIGFIVGSTSCASYKYTESKSKDDRGILLVCTNVREYYISTSDTTSSVIKHDSKLFYVVPELKKKYTNVLIFHPNYDTLQLQIKRTPRISALVKDIGLSLFSFGIPLILDLNNPDFYQVHRKSRSHIFELEYSQAFMRNEYLKIADSQDPKDFERWLTLYPKSTFRDSVKSAKDFLELTIALNSSTEKALEQFIFSHNESKFLERAKSALKSMQEARIEYGRAVTINSVFSYQNYLNKYPESIYKKDVQIRLYDVALNEIPYKHDTAVYSDFFKNYFHPIITSNDSDEKLNNDLSNKFITRVNHILARKHLSFTCENKYQCLSNLWNEYKEIELVYNQEIGKYSFKDNFENISTIGRNYQGEIYKEIFEKMKLNNSRVEQNQFISKLRIDFKFLIPDGDISYFFYNLINSVSDKNGLIKIWDLKYFVNSFYDSDLLHSYLFGSIKFMHADYWDESYIEYGQIESVDQEYLLFENDKIAGLNKLYEKNNLKLSFDVGNDGIIKEIAYYSKGTIRAKRYFYRRDANVINYIYEFVNGRNITEENYNIEISKADKLNALKKYEESLNILKKLRSNTYPDESRINHNLDLKIIETNSKLAEVIQKRREAEREKELLEYESRPYCRCQWCGSTYRSSRNSSIDYILDLAVGIDRKWVCSPYCSPKCKSEAENKL